MATAGRGQRDGKQWKAEVSNEVHRVENNLHNVSCDWVAMTAKKMKVTELVLDGHLLDTGVISCGNMP